MDQCIYVYFINSGDTVGYTVRGCEEIITGGTVNLYEGGYAKNILSMGIEILRKLEDVPYGTMITFMSPIVSSLTTTRVKKCEESLVKLRQEYHSLDMGRNIRYVRVESSHQEIQRIKRRLYDLNKSEGGGDAPASPTSPGQSLPFPDYTAYTDGSCNNLSHLREGGAAYIITDGQTIIKQQSKGYIGTTNNRMELLAILSAVASVPERSSLLVKTDSRYCIAVLSDKGNAGKLGLANADIIDRYFKYAARLESVRFEWIKGHDGNPLNELADELARSRTEEMRHIHAIRS